MNEGFFALSINMYCCFKPWIVELISVLYVYEDESVEGFSVIEQIYWTMFEAFYN